MWKSSTGRPDFSEAACASASVLCHFTLPGSTVGLLASGALATVFVGAVPATSFETDGSMRSVLLRSKGLGVAG